MEPLEVEKKSGRWKTKKYTKKNVKNIWGHFTCKGSDLRGKEQKALKKKNHFDYIGG